MNQDQIERDRLLTEVHQDVKHLVKNFDIHIDDDTKQFKSLKTRVFYLTIAIVVLSMIVGGPELLAMFIK